MGLLDDAIREHLELKRRRGADPAEIARAEQEALGPVRRERTTAREREAVAAQQGEHAAEPHAEAVPAAEAPAAPDDATRVLGPFDHGTGDEPAPADEHAAAPVPEQERIPNVDPREPAAPRDEPAADAPDPRHAADPDAARRAEIASQPTTEFRVEDHFDVDPHAPLPPSERGSEPPAPDPLEERDRPHEAPGGPDRPHGDPVAHDRQAQADPADEDVLEETPDFLQETPEHDRLWFEQRPPRDFDFDG